MAAADRSLGWSYAGLFAMILGAALLTPLAMIGVGAGGGPRLRAASRPAGPHGGAGVVAKLSRTGVAVAALMVAVSATVGVGVMIRSFRATVVRWLETSLVADVYVSAPDPPGAGRGGESDSRPQVIARLREAPGVRSVGTYRGVRVAVRARTDPARGPRHRPGELPSVPLPGRRPRARCGPPSRRRGGDRLRAVRLPAQARRRRSLRLRTDRGERAFPVAGVFADYGSDQGVVMVSRRTYEA